MRSSAKTEMTEMIKIVEVIMMILASEKWLLKIVIILNLIGAALAAATIQD